MGGAIGWINNPTFGLRSSEIDDDNCVVNLWLRTLHLSAEQGKTSGTPRLARTRPAYWPIDQRRQLEHDVCLTSNSISSSTPGPALRRTTPDHSAQHLLSGKPNFQFILRLTRRPISTLHNFSASQHHRGHRPHVQLDVGRIPSTTALHRPPQPVFSAFFSAGKRARIFFGPFIRHWEHLVVIMHRTS